jgi:nicotinamidase/pyrazinamidase
MTNPLPILFWDVDTQVDFMRPDGKLYVPEAEQIVANLQRLTAAAREHAIPVIASADDHEPTDPEISDDPDFQDTYPPHCLRGTPGVERVPETQQEWTYEVGHDPLPEAELARAVEGERPLILIHKKCFDVFTNPNTEPLVEALNPERIVLYGVALDVCNRFAIEGLLARGFDDLTLVLDATKPIHADRTEELLDSWSARGVDLTTTEALLESLISQEAQAIPR